LPLLLLLAIGAVASERLGRRGLLLILPSLLICVALSGFGLRLAGKSSELPTPTIAASAANTPASAALAFAPTTQDAPAVPTESTTDVPTNAQQADPPAAPTVAAPTIPVNAGGVRNIVPTAAAPVIEPTAAVLAIEPTVAPPTSVPVAAPARARDTTVIPILMYHYVRIVEDPKDQVGINLSVKPQMFAAQMQYLADKGYATLTMREVYAILAGQQPLPPKPIALTFDDGYRDFYAAAWPILKQHGFKATSYVITDFIGWDAYMTWPMLQELDTSGLIEIGAHTRSHADLRALSAARRWDEIIGSKAILEQGLGHPIVSFCYPAGYYNAAALADVKRANFLTAVTTQGGTKQNLQWAYELPRVRVNGPDPLTAWASKFP
jgi:peptidoglycan/xylan/chitin deacetylase (PgdA/CDA1 family)